MNDFTQLLERAQAVTTITAPVGIKQRIADTANEISLAGHSQAQLDIAITAIAHLIAKLYVTETDGSMANVDSMTGRILMRPLPWGESGAVRWGLRRWEGQCLRRLMLDRVGQRRRLPCLFDYNTESRQWHLNTHDYPTGEDALRWLKSDGPRLSEWRTIVNDYRSDAHARMIRRRN